MMTREEHLEWCKARAREYLEAKDFKQAVASMMSDLRKHPETERSATGMFAALALNAALSDSYDEVRRFIEGFN